MESSIIFIIFLISSVCLVWTYFIYIFILYRFKRIFGFINSSNSSFIPNVAFMIMTHNEEKVIEKKIKNTLDIDYPKEKMEILVVDSASTDKTVDIARKFSGDGVRVIRQKHRLGKASAINFGMLHSSSEIVFVTDANAILNRESLQKMMRHFSDPKVGGVGGSLKILKSEFSQGKGASVYWSIDNHLKIMESRMDSCVGMVGEIMAYRRCALEEIDETSLAEDFDATVEIRKKGFRIIHEQEAVAREPPPTNLEDELMQKKRRTIGIIQVLRKNRDMLFNPKYGKYGMLILPSHRLFQMLTPFFIAGVFVSTMLLSLLGKGSLFKPLLLIEVILLLLMCVSLLIIKFKPEIKVKAIVFLGYFMLLQIIVLTGWIDYLTGNYKVTWKKIESTRELSPQNLGEMGDEGK